MSAIENDLSDAVEMLGTGYEHPAIEIEQGRTVITRRGGKLTEETRPAFVKISTAFKTEMKDIDPIALKVWLYIALSVNRNSGKANPGLRKIAEDCDLAINTVRAALERLETLQLLTVDRQSKRYNIYEPVDYVSANKAEPTVSADDTDEQTVSIPAQTVSVDAKTVSPRMILNQINQSNQNAADNRKKDLVDGWAELAQMPGTKKAVRIDSLQSIIKTRLSIEPTRRAWIDFLTFADKRQQEHGESLTVFLDWLTSQPRFDVSYWPPAKMQENWARAFASPQNKQPAVHNGAFYG